jgi:hypothetical protein
MDNLPENKKNADVLPTNRYISLARGKKIAQIGENEFLKNLRDKLKLVYFEAGQDKGLDSHTLTMMATILSRDIMSNFKYITIDELSEALHLGVRKRFGDYYGLSVVTILSWVESYIAMPDRFEALKKAHAINEKTLAEKKQREDEAKRNMDMIIPNMVMQFKKYGMISDFGNVRFDYLVNNGHIQEDDYQKFIQQAEQIIYNDLEAAREDAFTKMDRIKSAHITKELDSLMDGNNSIVNKTAKKLCVQEFIKDYIDKNNL